MQGYGTRTSSRALLGSRMLPTILTIIFTIKRAIIIMNGGSAGGATRTTSSWSRYRFSQGQRTRLPSLGIKPEVARIGSGISKIQISTSMRLTTLNSRMSMTCFMEGRSTRSHREIIIGLLGPSSATLQRMKNRADPVTSTETTPGMVEGVGEIKTEVVVAMAAV